MRRTVATDSGLYYDHLLSVINSVIDAISHGGLAAREPLRTSLRLWIIKYRLYAIS